MKSLILSTAVILAAGVAGAQPSGQSSGQMPDQNSSQTSGQSQGQMNSGSMGGAMSDASLAAMIKATNDSEIKESKIAEKKAKSRKVKQFARMMIKDHSSNNSELASVSKRIGLQPSADEQTTAMKDQTQQNVQALESETGEGFDTAYLEQMIKDHQQALQKLDGAISSNSGRNEQLDGLLKKTRQKVSQHLDEARKLQSQLGSAGTGDMGNTPENKSGY